MAISVIEGWLNISVYLSRKRIDKVDAMCLEQGFQLSSVFRLRIRRGRRIAHIEKMASARGSGGSKCWGLCGFADQYAVRGRSCAGADAEQGIEGSMACSAPIEAEHELVEVMLEVCFPQSVIDAQAPALEV